MNPAFLPWSVALVLLATTAPAQALRGPVTKPDAETVYHPEWRDFSRLVVKFAEGHAVRLVDGQFRAEIDVSAANALLAGTEGVTRVFQRPVETLDAERATLLRNLPEGWDSPADLNNYFHVHCPGQREGRELLDAFNALDVVEIAFPEHGPTVPCDPGDILPVTPLFSDQQDYMDPAPTGIDQRRSRVIPGGRGEDLQVIDIESSWRLDHEDIPQLVQANVIGNHDESLNPNHGVAVVGEIAAEWDAFGVTGITDLCAVKVHSHMRQFWASSVDVAAANTPVGGFVVLEVQLSFQGLTSPMESRQDVFDATRNATLAGKHVIAAAGNGSNDLDGPVYGGIFDLNLRDSGAVLVGATDGASLTRASFSNYGSRVDANGWGRNVATTGYGNIPHAGTGDVRQQYTASFSGTSSATPIVTGAAMALTGAVRRQQGIVQTPGELRDLLRLHGTDVPGGDIGRRPDLEILLAAVGLPDGLGLVDATIGGTIQADIAGNPGDFWFLAAAWGPGFQLVEGQRFLLDPGTTWTLSGGLLGGTGSTTELLNVPNDPALQGSDLHLQALTADTSTWRLTNSARNYFW